MIKLLATGAWILVLTLGGVYAAAKFGQPASDHAQDAPPPPQYVQSETMTLPVVIDGAVSGYILIRSTLVVDEAVMKDVKVPMGAYVTDQLYTILVGDQLLDLKEKAKFDVVGFKQKIREGLNAHLEKPLVKDVLIEQMDFISKEAIEAKDPASKPERIVVDTDPEPPKSAAASASH